MTAEKVIRGPVFWDNTKKRGVWRAILSKGHKVIHIQVPNTDQGSTKALAEREAAKIKWRWPA